MTTSHQPHDAAGARTPVPPQSKLLLDLPFTEPELVSLREAVAAHASAAGLADARVEELVLIAYELASNAVRYGGGSGRLRLWDSGDALHCQVTDQGPGLPAVPRSRPATNASGGRGLWLVLTFADDLTVWNGHGGEHGADVTAVIRRDQ